jgi:hypothetical protein
MGVVDGLAHDHRRLGMSLTNEAVYPGEDGTGWYHEYRMGKTHSVIGYPKAKSPCDFNCHVLCTESGCDCECHE